MKRELYLIFLLSFSGCASLYTPGIGTPLDLYFSLYGWIDFLLFFMIIASAVRITLEKHFGEESGAGKALYLSIGALSALGLTLYEMSRGTSLIQLGPAMIILLLIFILIIVSKFLKGKDEKTPLWLKIVGGILFLIFVLAFLNPYFFDQWNIDTLFQGNIWPVLITIAILWGLIKLFSSGGRSQEGGGSGGTPGGGTGEGRGGGPVGGGTSGGGQPGRGQGGGSGPGGGGRDTTALNGLLDQLENTIRDFQRLFQDWQRIGNDILQTHSNFLRGTGAAGSGGGGAGAPPVSPAQWDAFNTACNNLTTLITTITQLIRTITYHPLFPNATSEQQRRFTQLTAQWTQRYREFTTYRDEWVNRFNTGRGP